MLRLVSRSLRPLLFKTGLLALPAGVLAVAAFIILRSVPLRRLRQAFASLHEEKERAQVTLHSIGDGVITTDSEGNVVLLNAVAETLTGWTLQEARGRRLEEIFHIVNEKSREVCENPVVRVLREMRVIELANHTVLIARDGTERVIADSGAPIRGADGRIIGVVLVFRDETEKQRHVEEVQKAAKLESLGVLAGGIAHDFNNILTAIMGNISLAMLDTDPDHVVHRRLTSAETACVRAKGLTYQLLTFAKGGAPIKQTVSLEELIRSSAEFALTGSNVRLEVEFAPDLGAVSVDSGQISQVMHNLVINAVEAMPQGGVVTVRAVPTRISASSGLPLTEGDYICISVQDRGEGVPDHLLSRIFDPYFTTKKNGSGLGLATCYSIVRNHGGHIAVESKPQAGAVFRFYLPASPPSEVATGRDSATPVIRGKGTVLLMDDEEAIRNMAAAMLSTLGYEAVFARDGAEAIERYRQAQASGKTFDAVILDLTVPGGMGGREAVAKLLELDQRVKAIVSSGYSENPVMSDHIMYGFIGALSKPYDVKQMGLVLHEVVRERSCPD